MNIIGLNYKMAPEKNDPANTSYKEDPPFVFVKVPISRTNVFAQTGLMVYFR
jgi:hypothetical protein